MVHSAGVIRGVIDPPAGSDALLAPKDFRWLNIKYSRTKFLPHSHVCAPGQLVPDMDSETGDGRLAVGGGQHHLAGDDRASAEGEAVGGLLQGRLPRILVLIM